MLRPTLGELLGGVAEGLRQSVLPALGPGPAQKQMKAALHVLGRLQRCWDLLPQCLAADNADMQNVLASSLQVAADVNGGLPSEFAERARPVENPAVPHIHDETLAGQASLNLQLQSQLVELDAWLHAAPQAASPACARQATILEALYARMVDRELRACAVHEDQA